MRRKHFFSYFAQVYLYTCNLVTMCSVLFSFSYMEWRISLHIFILTRKHQMFFGYHFNIVNYLIFSWGSLECLFLYWIVSSSMSSRRKSTRGNLVNRDVEVGASRTSQSTSGEWIRWSPAGPLVGDGKREAGWSLRCTELNGLMQTLRSMIQACAPESSDEAVITN